MPARARVLPEDGGTGEELLKELRLDDGTIGRSVQVLVALVLGQHAVAYAVLVLKRPRFVAPWLSDE